MRSIGPDRIPIWSSPIVLRTAPVPAPTDIKFEITPTPSVDPDTKVVSVEVIAMVTWELPDLAQVVVVEEEQPETPDNPTVPSPTPMPTPVASDNSTRVTRQALGSGSGSGSSGSGDGGILGELTTIYGYMGEDSLPPFSPIPLENVVKFSADQTSGEIKMTFFPTTTDIDKGPDPLVLYIQVCGVAYTVYHRLGVCLKPITNIDIARVFHCEVKFSYDLFIFSATINLLPLSLTDASTGRVGFS